MVSFSRALPEASEAASSSDPLDEIVGGTGACATPPVHVKAGVGSSAGTIPANESFHLTLVSIQIPVLLPTQPSPLVYRGQVIEPLFPTQIPHPHRSKQLSRAILENDILPLSTIKSVEDILMRAPILPLGVVSP